MVFTLTVPVDCLASCDESWEMVEFFQEPHCSVSSLVRSRHLMPRYWGGLTSCFLRGLFALLQGEDH